MPEPKKLISVLITVHNHQSYIAKTIKSLLAQSCEHIELLIIDNGSNDKTWEIIQSFSAKCQNKFARVLFQKQDHMNSCQALNDLFQLAKGEFIYLLASDAIAKPHALETLYNFLEHNSDYSLAIGDNDYIDETSQPTCMSKKHDPQIPDGTTYATNGVFLRQYHPDVDVLSDEFGTFKSLMEGNYIPKGYLLRKCALDKIGFIPEDAPLEEYYLLLKLALLNKFKYVDEVLLSYRISRNLLPDYQKKMDLLADKTRLCVIKNLSAEEQKRVGIGALQLTAATQHMYEQELQKERFVARRLRYSSVLRTLREKHKHDEKIKIVFLGFTFGENINNFVYLYKRFKLDTNFDVNAILLPCTHDNKSTMIERLLSAGEYLKREGIDFISGYDSKNDTFYDVQAQLQPDIVFFENPYDWNHHNFSIAAFPNSLTYYVPYGAYLADNIQHHFSQHLEQDVYKFIGGASRDELAMFTRHAPFGAWNICQKFLGCPKTENFFNVNYVPKNEWKAQTTSFKKIIWAPHHVFAHYGNFLNYKDFMLELAEEYKQQIQFVFKPHPGLKDSLLTMAGWTIEEVNSYYKKWDANSNTQLKTDSWHDLFLTSDAMILDSIGFMLEYALTGKPSCVITRKDAQNQRMVRFNECGEIIYEHLYHASNKQDIKDFAEEVVLHGHDTKQNKRVKYIIDNCLPPNDKSASDNIYEYVKNELTCVHDERNDVTNKLKFYDFTLDTALKYNGLQQASVETLILGSSHCDYGVNPQYLHPTAYNYGFTSFDLYSMLQLYKNTYSRKTDLKNIVICYSPFCNGYNLSKTHEAYRCGTFKAILDIPYREGSMIFEQKEQYAAQILNLAVAPAGYQGYTQNKPFLQDSAQVRATGHLRESVRQPQQTQYLSALLNLCAHNQHKVLIVLMPYRDDCKKLLPPSAQLFKPVYGIAGETCPILNCYDDNDFCKNDFGDTDHLNESGAIKLTKKIRIALFQETMPISGTSAI